MSFPIRATIAGTRQAALAAIFTGIFSASALSAQVAPKGPYALDPQHTQVLFEIKHMGISTSYGRIGTITGSLDFDQSAPEKGALNVQIDMHAIDTHVDEVDNALKESVFQVGKFPTATFTATKIVKTGENTGAVTGNLSLVGVTKPVTLNVVFNGGHGTGEPLQPYRIGFDATATVKRSDFGLTHMIWSGFVSDDVQLLIEAEAVRK